MPIDVPQSQFVSFLMSLSFQTAKYHDVIVTRYDKIADSLFCEWRHKIAFLQQRNFNWQFAQQKNNQKEKNAARVIYFSIL